MQIASLARALLLTTIANRADGTDPRILIVHASMHRAAGLLAALATLFRSSKCPTDLGGPMPETDPIQAKISVGFG